ncbi:hypothetical protein STRDD12_00721 [Streptococcus sp. DD12]|nr:hypothetical protein STRDD12_00721 [Streptococcus sp. DD12]
MNTEIDVIEEVYQGEVVEKGATLYLRYRNQENEQVVLKGSDQEWVMSRFSRPKSIMRFSVEGLTQSFFVTHQGQLPIYIQTQSLVYEKNRSQVSMSYSLYLDAEGQEELAHYDLLVSWGNF